MKSLRLTLLALPLALTGCSTLSSVNCLPQIHGTGLVPRQKSLSKAWER